MSPAQLFTFVFPSSPITCGLEILEYLFLLFPLPRIPSLLQLPRNSCFHQDLHWTHFPTKFSMEKSEGSVFLPLLCVCVCVRACVCARAELCLTLQSHELYLARLLYPWNSPGKNTGVAHHSLLQETFPTQGLNLVSHIVGGLFTVWATRKALLPPLRPCSWGQEQKEGGCEEGTNKTQAINTKDITGFSWS